MRLFLLLAVFALGIAVVSPAAERMPASGETFLWAELIAFDNASPDHGVAEYLARMPFKPKGISFLLFDPDIIHSHAGLAQDGRIGDLHCAYYARPCNRERRRQPWTAWQLRDLVATLKRQGVESYASFFDMAPGDSEELRQWGARRKPETWLDRHPEIRYELRDGYRANNVCPLKRFGDGTYYEDFFAAQAVRFLTDYGFAGLHAADGFGHPRYPLVVGDFSDDMIGQFTNACPSVPVPAGDVAARSAWIVKNARRAWCRFYAERQASFIGKAAKALHDAGLRIYLNSCWTRDPHEAYYRYGEDVRLLERAGIDGFFVESSVAGLEIEGWRYSDVSVLDRRRAAYLRFVGAVDVPLLRLCCVKDDLEEFNALRHSPMRTQGEILGLGAVLRGNRTGAPSVVWSLADAVEPHEWRQLDRDWRRLPPPAQADGLRVVWSSRAADAELDRACDGRWPSSCALLERLLHHGASLSSAVTCKEALDDPGLPLLVLNPGCFPEDELAALRNRGATVVEFGFGVAGTVFSEAPDGPDPDSWLYPLPVRTLPEGDYTNAVRRINASAAAVPDRDMPDLRLTSYRTASGSRVILAMNDGSTYLMSKTLVRDAPRTVRILTESPTVPVRIEPAEDGLTRLIAKIPPAGVIALLCEY